MQAAEADQFLARPDSEQEAPEVARGMLLLSLPWQQWVAENIAAEPEQLVDALCEEGVPKANAAHLVRKIKGSPELCKQLQSSFEGPPVSCPELSGDQFRTEFLARNKPVLLPNFLSQSPAVGLWSLDWFAETFEGVPIACQEQLPVKAPKYNFPTEEFVKRIRENKPPHLYSIARNLVLRDSNFSRLFDDLCLPPDFIDESVHRKMTVMWFGPEGTLSSLHYDNSNIVFAQVFGKKRVWLVPPFALAIHQLEPNQVVPDAYFKALDQLGVPCVSVVVEAGQSLFIPKGWFHRVESLEPSVTLSVIGLHKPA